jgi:hypothetical protein
VTNAKKLRELQGKHYRSRTMQKTEKRNLMAALRSKIVEQDAEIKALREQVRWVPVVVGYVSQKVYNRMAMEMYTEKTESAVIAICRFPAQEQDNE